MHTEKKEEGGRRVDGGSESNWVNRKWAHTKSDFNESKTQSIDNGNYAST